MSQLLERAEKLKSTCQKYSGNFTLEELLDYLLLHVKAKIGDTVVLVE